MKCSQQLEAKPPEDERKNQRFVKEEEEEVNGNRWKTMTEKLLSSRKSRRKRSKHKWKARKSCPGRWEWVGKNETNGKSTKKRRRRRTAAEADDHEPQEKEEQTTQFQHRQWWKWLKSSQDELNENERIVSHQGSEVRGQEIRMKSDQQVASSS